MLTSRINSDERLQGDAKIFALARTVETHDLVFDVFSKTNGCAAADILPGSGTRIFGVVYEIPDWLIKRESARSMNRKSLDQIEGKGTNYSRKAIRIEIDGIEFANETVITYVGKAREQGIKTSYEYSSLIVQGLNEHRMPAHYVDYVKNQVVRNNPDLASKIRNL